MSDLTPGKQTASEQQGDSVPFPTFDLRSEVCPMTFVRAKLYLDQVAAGDLLEFVLNDGEQMRNVPRSLKDEGHHIERVERRGNHFHLLVRKGQ